MNNVVGTEGNDTIDGTTAGTLSAGDVIVDPSTTDNDTLNATVTVDNLNNVISNIENLNIAGKFTTTGFDFANASGVKVATFSGGVMNTTATVAGVKASKVAEIVAGTNVKTLNITNDATDGTSGDVKVDAGSATAVTFAASAGADDSVTVTVHGNTTITNTGSAVETLTVNADADAAVTLNNIGTSLTVGGTGAVTLTSSGLDGETVTNNNGNLTVVNTAAGAVDLSKVSAELIKTGATLGAASLTVKNGAKLEVTADLGNAASTITSAAATASTNTVDVKFSTVAAQTGVVFTNIKTANVEAAAPAVTGTDLTFGVLDNGTNNIVLTGSNDVVVSAGTAKSFDASALAGKLTYTQATDAVTTVKAGTGLATAVFAGTTVNSTFVGADGGSNVTLVNTTGTAAVTGGAGNDIVSLTGILAGAGTLNAELGEGANSVTANAATTGTINVTSGSGADSVSANGLTTGILAAQLGGGKDSVSATGLTTGTLSVELGDGDDAVVLGSAIAAATIVVNGGAGTDTVTVGAGANFTAATLELNDVEVLALGAAGSMTFTSDQISGKSYTIQGTATAATDVLAVTAAAATAGKTIDLSTLTMDETLTKAIQNTSITGSAFADVIIGTKVADTITTGAGADTIKFAATAIANGSDTVTDFSHGAGGDILNFNAFLAGGTVDANGGTSGAMIAYQSGGTTDAAIAGKVVLLSGGTGITPVDTAAEIAALIDGANNVFSITAGDKAVVVAGSDTGTDDGFVYYVHDANGNGVVGDAGEVVLVGTLNNFDTDLLATANFVG